MADPKYGILGLLGLLTLPAMGCQHWGRADAISFHRPYTYVVAADMGNARQAVEVLGPERKDPAGVILEAALPPKAETQPASTQPIEPPLVATGHTPPSRLDWLKGSLRDSTHFDKVQEGDISAGSVAVVKGEDSHAVSEVQVPFGFLDPLAPAVSVETGSPLLDPDSKGLLPGSPLGGGYALNLLNPQRNPFPQANPSGPRCRELQHAGFDPSRIPGCQSRGRR